MFDYRNVYVIWILDGGFNLPLWKMMEWKSVGVIIHPIYIYMEKYMEK